MGEASYKRINTDGFEVKSETERFTVVACSTRSGNSFHDEISSKTRSARNEFLKGKVYLL